MFLRDDYSNTERPPGDETKTTASPSLFDGDVASSSPPPFPPSVVTESASAAEVSGEPATDSPPPPPFAEGRSGNEGNGADGGSSSSHAVPGEEKEEVAKDMGNAVEATLPDDATAATAAEEIPLSREAQDGEEANAVTNTAADEKSALPGSDGTSMPADRADDRGSVERRSDGADATAAPPPEGPPSPVAAALLAPPPPEEAAVSKDVAPTAVTTAPAPAPPPDPAPAPPTTRQMAEMKGSRPLQPPPPPLPQPPKSAASSAGDFNRRATMTGGGTAASGDRSAPSSKSTSRKSRAFSRKRFTIGSSKTFFFSGDRQKDIGVGTVGLYASKAVPVFSETYPSRGSRTHRNVSGRRRRHGNSAGAEEEGSRLIKSADQGSTYGRTFYTSTFYSTPVHGFIEAWEVKERQFEEWRSSRLSRSLYGTFSESYHSRKSAAALDAAMHPKNSDGEEGRRMLKGGPNGSFRRFSHDEPVLFGADGLPVDIATFEKDRLRAIAASRKTAELARAESIELLSRGLLERRRRRRCGEAVDLPQAYYERVHEVFPDKVNPATITASDHHRACSVARLQQRQLRALSEEQRREEGSKSREDIAAQLRQSKMDSMEFNEKLTAGLPRISRRLANEKRECRVEQQHEFAALQRSEREANRLLYYELEQDSQAVEHERQRGLQTKVRRVVAHRGGAGIRESNRAANGTLNYGKKNAPALLTFSAANKEDDHGAEHRLNADGTASSHAAAAAAAPPAVTAVPAVFQPTTTNFLSEVKAWQSSFRSPNVIPPTGADSTVRREWRRQLEEDRVAFNRETVSKFREEQPVRLFTARDSQSRRAQRQADEERTLKQSLKGQRQTADSLEKAYTSQVHRSQRGQRGRVQAALTAQARDRRQQVEMQRDLERRQEEAAARFEEAEQQHLREMVAASRE